MERGRGEGYIKFINIFMYSPLIRTEYRRLREIIQNFVPKSNINLGFQLFWRAYKPKTIFFGSKPAVQSSFIGKHLGFEQNFISQTLFKI